MSLKPVFATSIPVILKGEIIQIYKNIIVNRVPFRTTGYIKEKINKTEDMNPY